METSHVASKAKLFENFSSERDLNPRPSDYMSSTHWEVQIIIELMISTCPDSSDGRALDM